MIDKAEWEAEVNAMDVVTLEESNLIVTPISNNVLAPLDHARDFPAEMPSGVYQFGTNSQAIPTTIAAELRLQPDSFYFCSFFLLECINMAFYGNQKDFIFCVLSCPISYIRNMRSSHSSFRNSKE